MYLDIDSLYDTRLATLEILSVQLVKKALAKGEYFLRVKDEFPLVDSRQFKRVYSRRNLNTLQRAKLTSIVGMISNFYTDAIRKKLNTPFTDKAILHLNVWPYELTAWHADELARMLFEMTEQAVDIKVIKKDYKELSPQWCKEHYSFMCMYEWGNWLEYHAQEQNFLSCPIRDITIVVPELYWEDNAPNRIEHEKYIKSNPNPFRQLEKHSALLLDWHMLPIENWCAKLDPEFVLDYTKDV